MKDKNIRMLKVQMTKESEAARKAFMARNFNETKREDGMITMEK